MRFRDRRLTLSRQRSRLRPIAQESTTYSPPQGLETLGATIASSVQARGVQTYLGQRTKQPKTTMTSCLDTKRTQRRHSRPVNQPAHELHRRWRRGCSPEKITGPCVLDGLSPTRYKTHQKMRMGRCLSMYSCSCRLDQARQHTRPGRMPLGASAISLICFDPKRSRQMHKTSRWIRGVP